MAEFNEDTTLDDYFEEVKKKKEEEESNDLLVELPKDFKLLAQKFVYLLIPDSLEDLIPNHKISKSLSAEDLLSFIDEIKLKYDFYKNYVKGLETAKQNGTLKNRSTKPANKLCEILIKCAGLMRRGRIRRVGLGWD